MRDAVINTLTKYGYQTRDGRITSPGKFEGEPLWLPALWDAAIEGCADRDVHADYVYSCFRVDEEIADITGEPVNLERWLVLFETEQGFVLHSFVSTRRLNDLERSFDNE